MMASTWGMMGSYDPVRKLVLNSYDVAQRVVQQNEGAMLMGIDVGRIRAIAFGIVTASSLASSAMLEIVSMPV